MEKVRKHTDRLKAHLKRKITQNSLHDDSFFLSRQRNNPQHQAIKEMWENYLVFTRLEF